MFRKFINERIKKTLPISLQFSLRAKLVLSFSIVLAFFLLVAVFNLQQMTAINRDIERQDAKVQLKLLSLELKETVQEMNIIASGLELSKKPEYIDKYNQKRALYNEMIKRLGDTAVTAEQMKLRSQLITASTDYINNFDAAARTVQDKSLNAVDIDKNMLYLYNESQMLKENIFGLVDQFYVRFSNEAEQAKATLHQTSANTSRAMIWASVIALLFTAVIGFILLRSLLRPILKLQHAVGYIAEGDLRHTLGETRKDELGDLSRGFDRMIQNVRSMLGNLQGIALSLSRSSLTFRSSSSVTAHANADILKAIEEIAVGADNQASAAEQSASILKELEEKITDIAKYTDIMKDTGIKANHKTSVGYEAVNSLKQSSELSEAMLNRVYASLETLSASSGRIGKIVNTITDISNQTNVLALNAAIEAARAGAHGKGFAVIADQVRQLSSQTNQSSKDISGMIHTLQQQMEEVQSQMRLARETLLSQNSKVEESHQTFDSIRESMQLISSQIEQIYTKVDQATESSAILANSAQTVSATAIESAAGVQEVNSASFQQDEAIRAIASQAADMNTLAQNLFTEINRFRIEDAAPSAATPPSSFEQGGKPEEADAKQEQQNKAISKEPEGKSEEKQEKKEKELMPL